MLDKKRLFRELAEDYRRSHKQSEAFFNQALKCQIGGGSHNLRLFQPFPYYVAFCSGSKVNDIDGVSYIDFWQGHFGNILGHNPPVVLNSIIEFFRGGQGLASGFPGRFQKELAELILERVGAEKIRFTTSGTLATMYAIMLSKAYTGRNLVVKIGGGWHGAQPYTLKGIAALSHKDQPGLAPNPSSEVSCPDCPDLTDTQRPQRQRPALPWARRGPATWSGKSPPRPSK